MTHGMKFIHLFLGLFLLLACTSRKSILKQPLLLNEAVEKDSVIVYDFEMVYHRYSPPTRVASVSRWGVTRMSDIADSVRSRLSLYLRQFNLQLSKNEKLRSSCFDDLRRSGEWALVPFYTVDTILHCIGYPFIDNRYRLLLYFFLEDIGAYTNSSLMGLHLQAALFRGDSLLYFKDFKYSKDGAGSVKRDGKRRLEYMPPLQTERVFKECLDDLMKMLKD